MAAGPECEIYMKEVTEEVMTDPSKEVMTDPSKEQESGMSKEEREKKVKERMDAIRAMLAENPTLAKITEITTEITEFNATTSILPETAEAVIRSMGNLTTLDNVPFLLVLDMVKCGHKSDFGECSACAGRAGFFSQLATLDGKGNLVPVLLASGRVGFPEYTKELRKQVAGSKIAGIKVLYPPDKGTTASLGYPSRVFHKKEGMKRMNSSYGSLVAIYPPSDETARFEHPTVLVDLSKCTHVSQPRAATFQERVNSSFPMLIALVEKFKEYAKARGEKTTPQTLMNEITDTLEGTTAWTEQNKVFCEWFAKLLDDLAKGGNERVAMIHAILAFGVPKAAINAVKNMIKEYKQQEYSTAHFRAVMVEQNKSCNHRQTNPRDVEREEEEPVAAASSSSSSAPDPKANEKAMLAALKAKTIFHEESRLITMNGPDLRKRGWEVWELPNPAKRTDFGDNRCTLQRLLGIGRKFYVQVPTKGNRHSFGPFYELPVNDETERMFTNQYNEVVWPNLNTTIFSSKNDCVRITYDYVWVRVNAVLRPPNMKSYWFVFDTDSAVMRADVRKALEERYNSLPMFRGNFIPPRRINESAFNQAIDKTRRGEDGNQFTVRSFHFPEGADHSGVIFARYYNPIVSKANVHTSTEQLKFSNFWIKSTLSSTMTLVTQVGSTGPEGECASSM